MTFDIWYFEVTGGAPIRWRILIGGVNYIVLLAATLIAAVAGVVAAVEGWKGVT